MRIFTNKNIIQKIVIVLLMVIMVNFSITTSVQADLGGKLMSPLISLITTLVDGVQHLLEWAMLGETSNFMKEVSEVETGNSGKLVQVDQEVDGSFLGLDAVNIPVIQYTPEEIFSNRVPALDINFISPSIKTGNDEVDKERNVAILLQPTIASWYVALRTLAIVGLLSVLVYLGIRMMLTSVAADKAKYKKMLADWVVAMCLVFALHYIMSFALTISETVTGMISSELGGTVLVEVTSDTSIPKFSTNLMGYVRFMVQCSDLFDKLAFFFLYLMLVIYSVRFTWVYLKRVVNMAFLTLMAPLVALTYPIDKVSDGKAQAFNIWIKEFSFNALLQPLHLLLYIVLLGSATELAVKNPLYAVVALGFIIAAEKLWKKMFGFDKASGGTIGSLAGAAGVTAMAGKALNMVGKGKKGGGGSGGKVRTNEKFERTKADNGANKKLEGFNDESAKGAGEVPLPDSASESKATEQNGNGSGEEQAQGAGVVPTQTGEQTGEATDEQGNPTALIDTQGSPDPALTEEGIRQIGSENEEASEGQTEEPESWKSLRAADKAKSKQKWSDRADNAHKKIDNIRQTFGTQAGRKDLKRNIGANAYKTIRGVKQAAPQALYKGARGAIKTASRVALGGALAATAGVIAATTGNGENAVSAMVGAAGIGAAAGGNIFEATAGKAMKNTSVGDAYAKGKYGNAIDARNAKADKEYLKSTQFDEYYDKYFAGEGKSKQEVKQAFLDYRKSGITNEDDIRKAMKLEEKHGYSRQEAQNIVQTKSLISPKAFTDEKTRIAEINNLKGMLSNVSDENKQKVAEKIFRGYDEFRKM